LGKTQPAANGKRWGLEVETELGADADGLWSRLRQLGGRKA
jgi:hypothetical protein